MIPKRVKPDTKGRITLGSLTKGVSSFSVKKRSNGSIVLEPFVEIPAREKWLFENKQAMNKVKKGLGQASGKLIDKGDFTQFIDDEE
jgi:hypothetical protein